MYVLSRLLILYFISSAIFSILCPPHDALSFIWSSFVSVLHTSLIWWDTRSVWRTSPYHVYILYWCVRAHLAECLIQCRKQSKESTETPNHDWDPPNLILFRTRATVSTPLKERLALFACCLFARTASLWKPGKVEILRLQPCYCCSSSSSFSHYRSSVGAVEQFCTPLLLNQSTHLARIIIYPTPSRRVGSNLLWTL